MLNAFDFILPEGYLIMISIANMEFILRLKFLFLALLFPVSNAWAQIDTLVELNDIKITARQEQKAIPVQTLGPAAIEKLQALQVSDAVKHFAGVAVKDYGGIGGLKTVSVRGLGATHTGISYDGITINDSQSGQIDLGRFSMDNIEVISLSNGGPADIFQTARAFASGSLLNIKTVAPKFKEEEIFKGRVSVKSGSFGFINPTLSVYNKINKIFSTAVSGEWQKASGRYPYKLDNGSASSKETRQNTDVDMLGGEGNIFATFNKKYRASLKANYHQSKRGLPGAVIYYNSHSSQRLWDKNLFLQGKLEGDLSEKFSTRINAKYSSGYLRYLDLDFLSSAGKMENEYFQKEGYFSVAGIYRLNNSLQFSAAIDFVYNTLDGNSYRFARPSRYSWLGVVNGKWENERLSVVSTLVSTVVRDEVETADTFEGQQKLSPAITVGFKPFNNERVLFRVFYKDIFRMPTFNDLYYTGIGNTDLKPESAKQFNLGTSYFLSWGEKDNFFYLTADIYHNRIKNKILAIPTKSLFIWSMMNMGEVHINGSDLSIRSNTYVSPEINLTVNATYTFQKAIDMTESSSKTYKNQVAYIPIHSGSGVVGIENKWVNVNYNVILSGSRYVLNHNIPGNLLKGYAEHGISAGKTIWVGKMEAACKVEVLNLLNTQYEVVKSFPMPGRSVRIILSAKI